MIGKEKLSELIQEYYKQDKRIDIISEFIPSYYDSSIVNFGWKMFEEVLKAYFTEEGIDWIEYYLYENPEKCYYINDIKIPLETIDDLWELVKDNRKCYRNFC